MSEESSISFQAPWIPHTPMRPISPVEGQSNGNQAEESRFVGNEDVNGLLDHSSFGDLLALANTASSVYFSGQARWANDASAGINTRNVVYGEMLGDEAECLSSVSDDLAELQIKTLEKPKRKKHRPKIVYQAKPKRDP